MNTPAQQVIERYIAIQICTRARSRLHSLTHRHNLIPPQGSLFAPKHHDGCLSQDLCPTESLCLRHDLDALHHVSSAC